MSKPASLFTVTLRRLCDETGFAITHGEARVRMAQLGVEIAPETTTLSEAAKLFMEQYRAGKPWVSFQDACAKIGAKLKLEPKQIKRVGIEVRNRLQFENESNGFNVAKNQYRKHVDGGGETQTAKDAREGTKATTSTMMSKVAANSGARRVGATVKGPKPKHGAVVASADAQFEAFKSIEAMGGYKAASTKMEQLKKQAADLRSQADDVDVQVDEIASQLELAEQLQKRVAA